MNIYNGYNEETQVQMSKTICALTSENEQLRAVIKNLQDEVFRLKHPHSLPPLMHRDPSHRDHVHQPLMRPRLPSLSGSDHDRKPLIKKQKLDPSMSPNPQEKVFFDFLPSGRQVQRQCGDCEAMHTSGHWCQDTIVLGGYICQKCYRRRRRHRHNPELNPRRVCGSCKSNSTAGIWRRHPTDPSLVLCEKCIQIDTIKNETSSSCQDCLTHASGKCPKCSAPKQAYRCHGCSIQESQCWHFDERSQPLCKHCFVKGSVSPGLFADALRQHSCFPNATPSSSMPLTKTSSSSSSVPFPENRLAPFPFAENTVSDKTFGENSASSAPGSPDSETSSESSRGVMDMASLCD